MNLPDLYKKMSAWPLGKWLFTKLICFRAPYFSTIKPVITQLTANEISVFVKKRRSVQNHIGTVHAIALCNACELAAGVLMEAGLPSHLRWIPKGMTVSYLKKASTSVNAKTSFPDWKEVKIGDNFLLVNVFNSQQEVVMSAQINMYVSERSAKA